MTGNKKTILLVDDEGGTRNHIRQVLEGGGYAVLTATAYDEALAAYQTHKGAVDLVVSDVSLPGLSGCDLAIALREEEPEIRVLLMSGHSGAEVLQFFGMNVTDMHFLQKPFRPADLLQRVAQVFQRFGSASA